MGNRLTTRRLGHRHGVSTTPVGIAPTRDRATLLGSAGFESRDSRFHATMEVMRMLTSLVFVAGCIPTGGPPEGNVRGMRNGAAIDFAIDPSSKLILNPAQTCGAGDFNRFSLDYGSGAFHIEFDVTGVNALADQNLVVPFTGDGPLLWFKVDEPPAMVSATLSVGIDSALGRRSGDFRVVYADGGVIDGDFDLIYDAQGDGPSCGGGGDGDD